MLKASILKSTESSKGGYVNTLAVAGIKKDPILGDMVVNDRFYFKTPTKREPQEIENFALSMYNVTKFTSVATNPDTGEETVITSKWLTPLN